MPVGPRHPAGHVRVHLTLTALLAAGGCVSEQSALHPAGTDAADVARLFWIMTVAGAVIWTIVMAITLYAVVGRRRPKSERFADRFILVGGVVFPTVTLAVLLAYGLTLLPAWTQEAAGLRINVRAEQFWWRVTYERPGAPPVETANEVHLPAGEVADFVLTSPDVIHSFWIPVLGGKMDAIPGRETRLQLTPTVPGRYRGVCAEFCGASHALMAFDVIVHEPAAFDAWLEAETRSADLDAAPMERAGCTACHTVRGVAEAGRIGPDLTHLAAREHIAAGILPNTPENLRRWLVDPQAIKPGALMPPYAALPPAELDALVDLLGALE
jgi:cytochrome c oxidase subunit 2